MGVGAYFHILVHMKTVIIDYESGNLHSAVKAFEKVAGDIGYGGEILLTGNAFDVKSASHIVLPGVGAFGDCKAGLAALPGMIQALEEAVLQEKKPFLGICVGMQLLMQYGYEHGKFEGLGWIEGEVIPIEPQDPALKIPHMGWNELEITRSHPLFTGISPNEHVYFVHSYQVKCDDFDDILAEVGYGGKVTAAIARDNIMGVQFHPEKSRKTGMKVIRNFLMME